jgi:trehalose 2-sulfotransferase
MTAPRPRLSVFIATAPRSGSWLLADSLRHLDVGRPEEFFRADLETDYREQWGLPPAAPYLDFVDRVLSLGQAPNGVFAVKVHWFQFAMLLGRLRATHQGGDGVSDVALLERHFGNVRLVYLERTDTLRQAISWARAIRTNEWWSIEGSAAPGGGPVPEYDFETIKHLYYLLCDYKRCWREWIARSGLRPVEVSYETLARDHDAAVHRVVAALGLPVPQRIWAPRLVRQADGNTETLARAYQDSWRSLFDRHVHAP